jgi:hypothetical protein
MGIDGESFNAASRVLMAASSVQRSASCASMPALDALHGDGDGALTDERDEVRLEGGRCHRRMQ